MKLGLTQQRRVVLIGEFFPGVSKVWKHLEFVIGVILIGEVFFQIFDFFFAQIFNLPNFPIFSPNIGMLTNSIFLVLENFTNSDRTPPYVDIYLQLFPNSGNYEKNALR